MQSSAKGYTESTAQLVNQILVRSVDVWADHKSWTPRKTRFYDPFGGFRVFAVCLFWSCLRAFKQKRGPAMLDSVSPTDSLDK